ncbi:methyltransferase domain-containing protein [Fibrobacter sp.]|uniref:tRNA (guanine(46)-N(7))-methyltransferase TrmB n=1 Tax=Fibrobacter sp. TaxID=35828 RepID=UPI0025BC3529|nr:methyltransferase domain-containing protein [Fibrobacter sp.]MBR2059019.1 methyltransferase domain-containing protein [Fibrobacter sp.]MBR4006391.1 methyltransferase domain-containing protein [Fibrobacter sp.]
MSGARAVTTNQTDIYDKLEEVVRKYASTEYLRPIADHTRIAFAEAEKFVLNFYESACNEGGAVRGTYKVILDSGCGTGESSLNIAIANPDVPVIGIDKSAARLTKAGAAPRNAFLVRAELLDFWRLALGKVKAGQWHIPYHALYYPNPWPKQSEATRRFHLHPIFPTLLQLGDTLELRTNWELYAREFAEAARVLREIPGQAGDDNTGTIAREPFEPERPITAFERKYKEARQQLWRVTINHV